MDKILSLAQVVLPILLSVLLGMLARKKEILSSVEVQGLQTFVLNICLPCLLLRSCLTADLGPQTLTSMAMLIPFLLLSTLWAFFKGRKQFPYHNLPMLMCCKETGMIGLPMFMLLFGTENAFYMGVLDLAQAPLVYLVMGILSSADGKSASGWDILKQMLRSPLMLTSLTGIVLNLLGVWDWLQAVGAGTAVTETLGFLSQPVSMIMLFCVGYYFSLGRENIGPVLKLSAVHFAYFAVVAVVLQLLVKLLPDIPELTRWALLFYCLLPASYLASGMGRSEEDSIAASGVCSVLTMVCLVAFACLAAVAA